MFKAATDTHRLMYRNARLRAIDLSDHTTPIPFYNITDSILPTQDIGYIVHTDSAGYLYYGTNSQPVQCLAVTKSAIIQVDLFNSNAWDIEWIVHVEDGGYVGIEDVYKLYYADGTLAFDPLASDAQLPDFALKSEVGHGEWAEGEMIVTEETPFDLNIDKWTHVVTFRNGQTGRYRLVYTRGRYGQTIRMLNISDTDVEILLQHKVGAHIYNTRVMLHSGYQAEAAYTDHVGWYMMQPIDYINRDYVITSTDGIVFVDLDNNQDIRRIIYQPEGVVGLRVLVLNTANTSDTLPIYTIVNNTTEPLKVGRATYIGPNSYGPVTFYETVPAKSELAIAVRPAVVRACDGSRSAFVSVNAVTFENTNVHVRYTPDWWFGTISMQTHLYGVWLPLVVLAKGGGSEAGNAERTIEIEVNGEVIYSKTTTACHVRGEEPTSDPVAVFADTVLLSLNIRISKVILPGQTEETTLVDIDEIGGAAL